ncbi:MAG: ribonuclease J [Candidatus Peribacteraceae bacterium]|nr:ribonuclease J [bacterium]MDP6561613.1 ribonuclease J [Candidatus Peribacteraceae bacterium]|tara:strand:- start:1190 stop:3067 length:1878 start_codon:yes stop_codon:yes gene_type:complete
MKTVGEWLGSQKGDERKKQAPKGNNNQGAQKSAPHRGQKKPHKGNRPPFRNNARKPAPRPANKPSGSFANGKLRVYPLGGFEQVGRNCFVIEVDQDIYIIDLGLQFPDEDMLGIDYLIPDCSSLRGKENRIKAVLFTHGHLDHIGAVQHLMNGLHFPPCFGTKLTMAFVRKRLDEEKLTSKCKLNNVEYGKKTRIGKVEVEFLKVTHSIPDSAAIALHTPYGTLVHTGDFKFDLTPMNEEPADFQRLAKLGEEGVLAIIADSTNAAKPGHSKSEADISETLHKLIRDAEGRVIVSTFSSLLNRIQQVVEHAKKYNRKVFVSGRSMITNIEIAQNLGYIKAPRGTIRKVGPGMDKLPDDQVIILTTGSQGEEMAGLARIGLGTHRQIGVKKGDTIILSSNPIIGNERAVAKVINNLSTQGAIVKTNAELALHVTGHGNAEDILLMHRLVKPKHIIPEHGEPSMRTAHANLAKKIGYADNQIHLLSNGEILEFDANGGARRSKSKIEVQDIIIDGKGGAAGEGQRVIRDRQIMSKGGSVVVVMKVYKDSKRLVGDPDVLSRGLIYGSEQEVITKEVVQRAKKAYIEALDKGDNDRKALKRSVNSALYRYFDRKLNREPMVIPIIVEV